ncbi:MAG TPA: LysR family transcriptional regulator [Rhodobacteraceae bacterium]|nr:LysR family transcriptional regulator [Paracoccaceae bacterium]
MNIELRDTELRRLDLTLLLVFLGLLKHRKAADVAVELGLSRSAISQALGRLRDIFGDELFLRQSHGLAPTALALGLEAPVVAAVESLRGALGAATAFDPSTASGVVRIGAGDVEQVVLVPALAGHIYQRAPDLKLEILPLERAAAKLADGQMDLALVAQGTPVPQLNELPLYQESWRAVCQPQTLNSAGEIPAETFSSSYHTMVSGVGAPADTHYCVALTMPNFLGALAMVPSVGGIAVIPARLAERLANGFGLVHAPAHQAPPDFTICVQWHQRNQRDARLNWVIEQIKQVVSREIDGRFYPGQP